MILGKDRSKLVKLEMEMERIKKSMKKYKWMYKEMKGFIENQKNVSISHRTDG